MPKNKLSESIDHFGVPLFEGVEVEVKFKHKGEDAVAVFDVSGGSRGVSSRDFPPEDIDPDVELIGIYVGDDKEINPDAVDLRELENEAIEKYFDQQG